MIPLNAAGARAEFHKLRETQSLTPDQAARLAEEAARACLDAPRALDEGVLLLCDLAMLPDPALSCEGADGIFRLVTETMADAFDPRLCDLYIEFFARVLQYCRSFPQATWLNRSLNDMGLTSEQDLILRARQVRQPRQILRSKISKIVVLSRVTLGADVAITSVVLQKMMRTFPQAELILAGSQKAALLFAGESRIQHRRVDYPRGGGLLDRLAAWQALVELLAAESKGLSPEEYLVIDPDTRLTQLGMLPVLKDESSYCFFESRSFSRPGLETLGELASAWLDETFGPSGQRIQPWLSLAPKAVVRAGGRWASVNLGVGDNSRKRIEGFEERLLGEMLRRGWKIFLDKGDGGEETARVERLLALLRDGGWKVDDFSQDGTGNPDVVAWRGSLAGFGSLIGVSDLYIGYDSACQHIAAALGIDTINIFAGFSSPQMPKRWRPAGHGKVSMIVVPSGEVDSERVLDRVLELVR